MRRTAWRLGSHLLLVEVGQDEASAGLQLWLCVRLVERTRLNVVCRGKWTSNQPKTIRKSVVSKQKNENAQEDSGFCFLAVWSAEHGFRLTLLIVAGDLVGHPVHFGRRRQHEGEAHEQGRVLRQRAVGLRDVTVTSGEIGAAAGGVADSHPLAWGRKHSQCRGNERNEKWVVVLKKAQGSCTLARSRFHSKVCWSFSSTFLSRAGWLIDFINWFNLLFIKTFSGKIWITLSFVENDFVLKKNVIFLFIHNHPTLKAMERFLKLTNFKCGK